MINRKERRRQAHAARKGKPGAVVSLCQDPNTKSAKVSALLLGLLSEAYALGRKIDAPWPIHVHVRLGDEEACGNVRHGTEGDGAQVQPDVD